MKADLGDGILLRALHGDDAAALAEAYTRNREHLAPWDPQRADDYFTSARQGALVAFTLGEVQAGRSSAMVLTDAAQRIVGRVNLSDVVRGSFQSAHVGYWLDAQLTGRGLMRRAVAAAAEHAHRDLGLHRLQAATLVHNAASQRVLSANGFTPIGRAERYLKIAGEWQDHLLFQRLLE